LKNAQYLGTGGWILATPEHNYLKRKARLKKLSDKQSRYSNRISNLRLLTFVAGLGLALFLYAQNTLIGFVVFAVALVLFIYLVTVHSKISAQRKLSSALKLINENSLKRLSGEWVTFPDTGEEMKDAQHPYSRDLDLFGKASLFQLTNTTQTFLGRERLKLSLIAPEKTKAGIIRRQEVITELSKQITWRQRLIAEGMVIADKLHDPEPLFQWARQKNSFYRQPWVKYLFRTLPVLTSLLILSHFFVFGIPLWVPVLALICQFILLIVSGKDRAQAFKTVYTYEGSIKIYAKVLKLLEDKKFTSPLLQELQAGLKNKDKQPAYLQVKKLSKLVDSLSNRNNAMFFFVNILTLWDYQCMIALEEWKSQSGKLLSNWLSAVGEVESLASLAALSFDNPDWVIPEVTDGPPVYSSKAMGHPLLSKGRIANDIKIDPSSGILLITGSNMSGKSTLLRTVGINLVLAYAGAPVCAQRLRCSQMSLYSCMRVSDNLEQSISSFYAELLRIKLIVQAAEKEKQVFFLLDEIFKGTNSQDRHTGAKLLIKQLGKQGALGMVSTHDLELGDLERESGGKIRNYHFREYYKDDQIHFDYKLRPGLSTTRNAMYLIRMAGIDTEQ
jgi:DNA mismatch repair ATPase MutS